MNLGMTVFKKTRIKIIILIMILATIIISSILSVIYISNTKYNFERGISLIKSYIENEKTEPGHEPEFIGEKPFDRLDKKDDQKKMFRLSTFYSVYYDLNNEIVRVNDNNELVYTQSQIINIADEILSRNKNQGIYNSMTYLVSKDINGTVVALIDTTMEKDNTNRLFAYSLYTGAAGWLAVLVLACYFSKKIVNPLEQNDTKQKQFISDAGHELKTPISVINANADLLARELGENKWLSNIQYENERMGNLVKQLLELVGTENKKQIKDRVDFSNLISGGVLPFESVAFENGLNLNTDIEEKIFVAGDSNQLSQLVSILVDNAIEYNRGGKDINVRLFSNNHQAVLSVVNSGEPISEKIRERLFERFYRADSARTDENGHYGLGLAIAKAIVTNHGGKITVDCYDGLIEFKVNIPKN